MRTHQGTKDGSGLRVGVVVSRFNQVVTERLLAGATETLRRHGVSDDDIDVVWVPGAFEIPLFAKTFAASGRIDAVICLGAVIRGETPHFEYISAAVFHEIAGLIVRCGRPIALGVLTTNSVDQALQRSGAGHGNKGAEAAMTAIEMATLQRAVRDRGWGE